MPEIRDLINFYDIQRLIRKYSKYDNTDALRQARCHALKIGNHQRYITLGVVADYLRLEDKQC